MRRRSLALMLGSLFGGLTLLMALPAGAIPVPIGCYLHTTKWEKRDCNDLRVSHPFNPEPNKCYFSWYNGAVRTIPVQIDCEKGPAENAPVQLPQNFTPGAPAKPVIPRGCPGSPLPGPGTENCAAIPVGCPGSTQTGERPASFNPATCQYSEAISAVLPAGAPAAPNNVQAPAPDTGIDPDRATAIECDGRNTAQLAQCFRTNPLVKRFRDLINFLGAGVGVIVVIMIMIGGLQYMSAGNNPQAVTTAKKRILGAVLALLAYTFLWAFMQWLVPGGIF